MIHRVAIILTLVALLAAAIPAQKTKDEVRFDFSGLFKIANKREIVIEPDPENQMTFVRSKRTRFIEAGKEIQDAAIKPGSPVTVQAVQKLNGDLEAITVTVLDPDHSPDK